MKMRFAVLNGPPGCGKSTIAREVCSWLNKLDMRAVTESFAAPMKHTIAAALGAQYQSLPKESPRAELNGYSVREFLIDLSENYLKPRYGHEIFGKWLYHRVGRLHPAPDLVIVDDCGFPEEVMPLGVTKPFVIRINRPGKTYDGDSRKYLPDPHYTVENNGTLIELMIEAQKLAEWLREQCKC